MTLTFNSLPEVVAVSPYRAELAEVVVSAPDVHVLILGTAHNKRVVMARRVERTSNIITRSIPKPHG